MNCLQLFVAQAIASPPPGPSWTAYWFAFLIVVVLVLLQLWILWRIGSLVRVTRQLQQGSGQGQPVPGPLGFLRFRMRTMLVAFTIAAVLLGLFANEFSRARRQGKIVEHLQISADFREYDGVHYQLGKLGDSKVASLICDWVHPHFGCRLTRLVLEGDRSRVVTTPELEADFLASLADLRDLEALQIIQGDLTDEELEAICSLPKLYKLSLSECNLPQHLGQQLERLPQLQELELSSCHLVDEAIQGIGNLKQLRRLSVRSNRLTNSSLREIARLHTLDVLDVSDNPIDDAGVGQLLKLKKLVRLHVGQSNLTPTAVAKLDQLPRLRYLNLVGIESIHWNERGEPEAFLEELRENPLIEIDWDYGAGHGEPWELRDNRPGSLYFGGGGVF
ncbi:leucine-rich repeat domain-containing protein [Aeoliella sp.]|uniref:leucine-rich repeat domain-containing protein n=1 Tax=Aeoliella sp. TaxID=2795800 RepID=UPI003CCBC1A0